VWKEFLVSLLCGVSLALLGFLKAMFVDRVSVTIALVIALTLFVTIVCAKLVGCVLPMLAKKLGFDPAVMASPFITTIVDAIGLVVYFKIATLLLDALK
jgi:magnesium transporter